MQDMMKNLMGDMWKSVGDINAPDFMGDMNPSVIGRKVLDFQKSAFNNTYNVMLQIQEQTEKIAEPILKNNPVVPAEWKTMFKKNQDQMKKAIDDGFAKAESYFATAEKPAAKAKPEAAEKAEPKAK